MATESEKRFIPEVQQKVDSQHKNVFLCYRGTNGRGGEVARLLYYNMIAGKYTELVPFCASLCNYHENFEIKSIEHIRTCKVFVPIFTDSFFDPQNPDDDQVRLELAILFGEIHEKKRVVEIAPVFVGNKGKETQAYVLDNLVDWLLREVPTQDKSEEGKNGKKTKRLQALKKQLDVTHYYTIDLLRENGYFKDKSDKELLDMLKKFGKFLLHEDSHPVVFDFEDGDGETNLQMRMNTIVDRIKLAFDKKVGSVEGKVWVGTRLSDIENTGDLLTGAITLFGENSEERNHYALCDEALCDRVDHNIQEERQDAYIRDTMHALANSRGDNADLSFYFYNQLSRYTIAGIEDLAHYCICVNPEDLLKKISNKLSFQDSYRHLCNNKALLDVIPGNYTNCDYTSICKRFGLSEEDNHKFIVQAAVASGGSGTYVMTKENAADLQNHLSHETQYLYSIYREHNVPVNMHAIIFGRGVVLLPGSIQLMRVDYDKLEHEDEIKRLMYRGADFIEYARLAELEDVPTNKVNSRHIQRFRELCMTLCEKIKEEGYKGVLGIDGMIYDDEVRLLEVNCRFQASTGLINRALADQGLGSVQEANFDAFYNPAEYEKWKNIFDSLRVGYANYSFNNIGCNEHPRHMFTRATAIAEHAALLEKDGYSNEIDLDTCAPTAHLFRMNFTENICWVNEEGSVLIHENICEPVKEFKNRVLSCATAGTIDEDSLLALKIALMTQGVVIDPETMDHLVKSRAKGIRPATNSAVDIAFSQAFMDKCNFAFGVSAFVINAPLAIKLNEFTPFSLTLKRGAEEENTLVLSYYDTVLADVSLYPLDPLEKIGDKDRMTRGGFKYSEVAYLSTDRLRVHVTNSCTYKESNNGCQFCNIECTSSDIGIKDIKEVIDMHWEHRKETGLRHFLIGGQSPRQNAEMQDKLRAIIEHIHSLRPTPPIYAMILPCQTRRDLDDGSYDALLDSYFGRGLTELSLNIEIFDERLARKYMPGKGQTSREIYKECLLRAKNSLAKKLGGRRASETREKIRTMIIYGLEPEESFMEGMEWLVRNNIQPIISLFRPLKGTPLADYMAPPMAQAYHLYKKMEEMYADNGQRINLGPVCSYCQNNTLSLPESN